MTELNTKFMENIKKWFWPHVVFFRLRDSWEARAASNQCDQKNIEEWNNFKNRRSIFFTPNWDQALAKTTTTRSKSDTKTIYCLVMDIDHEGKTREDFVYQPSIIVKTFTGHHLYWLLESPVAYNEEQFERIEWFLVDELWWDATSKNAARYYRLPWSIYWSHKFKDKMWFENDWSIKINVVSIDESLKYTLDQFDELIKQTKKIDQTKSFKELKKSDTAEWTFQDINERVNVIDVLTSLWWWKWTLRWNCVLEDWKETSWYKYFKNKNWLNNFSWSKDRPIGGPFAVAKRFIWDDAGTFKYFRDTFWIGKEVKNNLKITKPKKQVESMIDWIIANLSKEDSTAKIIDSWWTKILSTIDDVVIELWEVRIVNSFKEKRIYKQDNDSSVELLSASLKSIWYYTDKQWINTYIVEYAKTSWETGIMNVSKLGKRWELEKKLSEVWLVFFGTPKLEKLIISYIYSCSEKHEYIDAFWIYSKNFIINKAWEYIKEANGEKYYVKINDFWGPSWDWEAFTIWEKMGRDEFLKELSKLADIYEPMLIYTLFTVYAMGMFSYYMRKTFRKWVWAGITWATQSWKTTIRQLIMKTLWISINTEALASTSNFPIMEMSKHYIPISISEYGNATTKFDWDEFLKNNYDNIPNRRWTSTQSVNLYPSNSIIIIDWETWSNTNSVNSRKTFLQFTKFYKKWPVQDIKNLSWYLLDNYDNIDNMVKNYKFYRAKVEEHFKDIVSWDKDRILDNTGYLLAFAKSFDFDMIVEDHILKQTKMQFCLMPEDMLMKITKLVMGLAAGNNRPMALRWKNLEIDIMIDVMRVDTKKYDDFMSNIKTANFNFNAWENWYMWSEKLVIPMQYIFDNKEAHYSFNRVLNLLAKWYSINSISDEWVVIWAIRAYAKKNWYIKEPFYVDKINNDVTDARETSRRKAAQADE